VLIFIPVSIVFFYTKALIKLHFDFSGGLMMRLVVLVMMDGH
jgi:hypothetical protein